MSWNKLVILGSSLIFLVYGILFLCTSSMKSEFQRFGLEHLRSLTGVLQVLGGAGLLVGLKWRFALRLSSACLSLLMLAGLTARIRAGDSWILCLPAVTLMVWNAYILRKAWP